MNSCKNPQRTVALLATIALHLALIAAAAWLTPPVRPVQRNPVLIVTLHAAAPASSPAAVLAAPASMAVPQTKNGALPKRPKTVPKSVPKIVPQQKAQPRLPAAAQVPGLPNQPQNLAAPTAPPQSQPQQQIARPEPSSTQNHAPDASPAGTPEAPPIAAKTGVTSVTNVTNVTIPAAYAARNRKPDYPLLSRRYNEQGTVVLRVLVNADGTAGAVHIKQSSGYPLLDQSALAAARDWRFVAATQNGKPVSEWYEISIPYTLQD